MLYAAGLQLATPRARGTCPGCDQTLIAKCGQIVTWHWAHENADCDPWSEPESEWHRGWKQHFVGLGDAVEVVMPPHRADIVTATGFTIELQSDYLPLEAIAARETFYGPRLRWLYRCHWGDRLHFGRSGFWWKHGAKSMTHHRRPIWWDMGDELIQVTLTLVTNDEGERVLGRVLRRRPSPMDTRANLPSDQIRSIPASVAPSITARSAAHPETIAKSRAHRDRRKGSCADDIPETRGTCTCQPDPDDLRQVWAGRARMAKARRVALEPFDALDATDLEALERAGL